MFGNTIHNAKESYKIEFPSISKHILPAYINETATLNKILLMIIENDELRLNDHLPLTNIFILINLPKPVDDDSSDLVELRNFKLSKSCRNFSIKFRDSSSDFSIFEEFKDMSLNEKTAMHSDSIFYQLKTFVKGFKDTLVNEQSIWN